MSEIVLKIPEELKNQFMETVQEAVRVELSRLQDSQSNDSYKTRKEIALRFGVSESTIDRMARGGILKKHTIGRSVRFIPEQVETALREVPALKKYRR